MIKQPGSRVYSSAGEIQPAISGVAAIPVSWFTRGGCCALDLRRDVEELNERIAQSGIIEN
jgi:hypothetical protein